MARKAQSGPSLFDDWDTPSSGLTDAVEKEMTAAERKKDADPAPKKPRRNSRKAAEAEQTTKCLAADEELARIHLNKTTVVPEEDPWQPSLNGGAESPTATTENVPDSTSVVTPSTPPSSPDAAAALPVSPPVEPNRNGGLSSRLASLKTPLVSAKAPKRQPTEEQRVGIEMALELERNGGGVLIMEAGAGCGKTSELVMLEESLSGIGQYTAFNAPLIVESKKKFKKASVNTFHSLAFRSVGKQFAHRLNQDRVRSEQVAEMLSIAPLTITVTIAEELKPRLLSAGFLASQVMGAVRKFCQSAEKLIDFKHFRYIDGIDAASPEGKRGYANNDKVREYLLPYAEKAWADLSNPEGVLPFTHDYYVKVWELNNPVISANYILADEVQDLSPVMLSVFEQQKNCLLVMVGDSAQQIYEFRGAIDALKAFPGAPRCQLSQSFRFGPAIADLANQVLNCLQEKTPLNLKGLPSIQSTIGPVEKPVAILTRTNAAAIQHLLTEIAAGRKPFLVGGGADVISFVQAALDLQQGKGTGHPELACFGSWVEVQTYVKEDTDGEDLKLMVKLIDTFGCTEILTALKSMPAEKDADLVISTAHRSKGREWKSVKLAADFPTKSKSCDSDLKLLYVALTRAQEQLDVSTCPFFIGEDCLEIIRRPAGMAEPTSKPVVVPTTFSFSRSKDGTSWLVRGPVGYERKTVDVTLKNGTTAKRRLGKVVANVGDGVATYEVF